MSERRSRRYLFEALTIVASILFALWVDANWEDYQDRQRERQYIEGLNVEFEAAASELATDQRVRREVLANLRAALDSAEGSPSDEARRLASDPSNLLNARFYTPSHAHLDDLLSSGSLQLLRSRALRLALLTYLQERDRLAVVEQSYREFVKGQVRSFVLEHAELGVHPPGTGPDSPRPLSLALWDDPRFVNLVWLEFAELEDLIFFADRVGERIATVQAILTDS